MRFDDDVREHQRQSFFGERTAVDRPIGCISQQACLKAKHLCKRQAKAFLPLRSRSATSFARAIKMLIALDEGLEACVTSTKVNAEDWVLIDV